MLGAMKTKTESTLNIASAAFFWLDFMRKISQIRLYIACEAAIQGTRARIHILGPKFGNTVSISFLAYADSKKLNVSPIIAKPVGIWSKLTFA